MWRRWESNPRPLDCQSNALASWATSPCIEKIGFIELSISYKKKIVMQIYTFVWISMQKPTTNSFTNKNKRLSNITWFKLHFIIKKLEVLMFSIYKKWGAANYQLVSIDDIIELHDNVKISTIHYLEYQYLGYLLELLLERTLGIWHHLE